jgi:hypothetical protein
MKQWSPIPGSGFALVRCRAARSSDIGLFNELPTSIWSANGNPAAAWLAVDFLNRNGSLLAIRMSSSGLAPSDHPLCRSDAERDGFILPATYTAVNGHRQT